MVKSNNCDVLLLDDIALNKNFTQSLLNLLHFGLMD